LFCLCNTKSPKILEKKMLYLVLISPQVLKKIGITMNKRREKRNLRSWAWYYMPVIPAFRRLRQGDYELDANLGKTLSQNQKTTTTKSRLKVIVSRALVAHACNPSCLGGRDQENQGSKSAQANSSGDPGSEVWWSGSRCRP
jgi:hypothetical protein